MFEGILKLLPAIRKVNFYVFTLLWIITILVVLPFSPIKSILSAYPLEFVTASQWFIKYETLLFQIASIFFLIYFFVVLLCVIAWQRERREKYIQLDMLSDGMMLIGHYYIMIMEILHSLGITQFGMLRSVYGLANMISHNWSMIFSMLSYFFSIVTLLVAILDYFIDIRAHS
ncbi:MULTISPECIES: hypothetical protein [Agathobaculum]|uniref:hypothetical protein n=1 Tax=Agathobaculum TaxID=2048137 RepID=UPI003F8EAE77